MKKKLTHTLFCGLLMASSASFATVISFDNTSAGFDSFGSHTESGFTLAATEDTQFYTVDPSFIPAILPAQNNTDFAYFQSGTQSALLTAASPFSLQSFYGANLLDETAGSLTLTGLVSGGGTLSQVFTTLGGNQWSLFNLTGWDNLTQVNIVSQRLNFALDSITVGPPIVATAPEPSMFGLFFAGLLGLGWVKNRKRV